MATGSKHDVWHKEVPSKVSLFAWRLLQDRLPTEDNLVRRHALQPNDNLCVGGYGSIETAYHFFIGCAYFGNVWNLIYQWLDISFVCQVWLRIIMFNFATWRVCRVHLLLSSRLFGWRACGLYGRIGITIFSRMR